MTEAEWLTCDYPELMLSLLYSKAWEGKSEAEWLTRQEPEPMLTRSF